MSRVLGSSYGLAIFPAIYSLFPFPLFTNRLTLQGLALPVTYQLPVT